MTQFSLFGAEAAEPLLADLGGVLLAGGHWVRTGDGTRARARLSVVVTDAWRAEALTDEFASRGLVDEGAEDATVAAEGGFSVRTAFTADLLAEAARWTRGTRFVLPTGDVLTAAGLRLWCIAAGRHDEGGHLLGTARADDPLHTAAGSQLARWGLAAVSLGPRGGPGWRVSSVRRIRRLAELVGPAPPGGERDWPVPR